MLYFDSFLGQHEVRVDDKNRISIPASFRPQIKHKELIITKGFERCLTVFTVEVFREYCQNQLEIFQGKVEDQDLRRRRRALTSSAEKKKIDKQWRVVLPKNLLDQAGINDELMMIGNGNRVELWNKEQWHIEESQLPNFQ